MTYIGWALKGLIGLVLLVHAYALALKVVFPPTTLNMAGSAMDGQHLRRNLVKIEEVSPHLIRAVLAAEDSTFCEHRGIDMDATRTAWADWRAGKRLRGASTITQQTAKNVFLWNGGSFARKLPEAWLALFTDFTWGKRRVMEMYLNVAEWGDGLYGIEAAARVRFGKTAAQLNRQEAALLAAVLPSPNKWRVDPPGPYVRGRARTLRARMNVIENEGLDACVLG